MESVVIDTNVLVSAFLSDGGASRQVLRIALSGELRPIVGEKLFTEYEDVLSRTDLFRACPIPPEERSVLFDAFLSKCTWTDVFFLWRPNLPDEGDNHIVELAVAGNANVIITHNEKDFRKGELKFLGIEILTPKAFVKRR